MRGHIRKRGRSWCVVVYVGRDPTTGKPRYKWFTHGTKKEAEAHLAQIIGQINGGGSIPSTKLRVGDFLDQWLNDYARASVGPVTFRNYADTIRKHLKPQLGHILVARLSPQAIQSYFSRKLDEGLSPSSVQTHYLVLHEALHHAVRWGLIARNPADLVDPPRRRKFEPRIWDEEQTRLFLAEAKRSSPYYALYLTAIMTGMRQGELLGLRWQDLDLTTGVARIHQTFYRLGGVQIFKEPKTETSKRAVALPPAVVEELLKLRSQQDEYRRLFGSEYAQDLDLVFCQPNGKPLHGNNIVRRDFRAVIERVGLPRIRFHDLRHLHASHLARAGVPPKVAQERLGHATPTFTMRVYTHTLAGMQESAARAIEDLLLGRSQ